MSESQPNYKGCLYEQNNVWHMRIYHYENGIRKLESKTTKLSVKGNKKKAQAILDELLNEYNSRVKTVSDSQPFIIYMREWVEAYKHSVELNTYESYRAIVERYLAGQPEETIPLQELTPIHIQSLYNRLISKGIGPNTVLKFHANVRKALQYAYQIDLLPTNPADKVMLPKKKRFFANFYTNQQVLNLLELTKDEPMYPAILLAAVYGLRRSEILGLKWKSVDLDAGKIIIKDTVVGYKTVVDKEQTKTKSSYRTLPVTKEVAVFLRKLQAHQAKMRLFFGKGYAENDYVCRRDNGEPFAINYFTERFGKIIKKHGLPKLRFHDLRHSAANMLLASGYSLKEIQEYLGHGDIATTANIYSHLLFEAKQDMADSIGRALLTAQ